MTAVSSARAARPAPGAEGLRGAVVAQIDALTLPVLADGGATVGVVVGAVVVVVKVVVAAVVVDIGFVQCVALIDFGRQGRRRR